MAAAKTPTLPSPTGLPGTIALALMAACYGLAWLGRHPFTDEGSVCQSAARLLEGSRLYADVWNEKSPLHYVVAALWSSVFGATFPALRALAACEFFVVLLLVVRLASGAPWLAATATLALAPWYQAHHAVNEATMAPLALAMMLVVESGAAAAVFVAGLLAATGVWVKQNFAAVLAAFAGEDRRRLLLLGAGALVGSLAWLAVFYAHAGAGLWTMPPFGEREAALPAFSWEWGEDKTLLAIHLAGTIVLALLATRGDASDATTRRLALGALGLALPALARPGSFRAWPSAVLAIVAAARIVSSMAPSQRRSAAALALAVLVPAGLLRWSIDDGDFTRLERVAARIRELVPEREKIWVGPHEALLYCLSARRTSARVDFALPWSPSPAGKRELLAALETDPPRVIVDAGPPYRRWQGELTVNLPGIDRLLDRRYRRSGDVDGFEFWVLTPPELRGGRRGD